MKLSKRLALVVAIVLSALTILPAQASIGASLFTTMVSLDGTNGYSPSAALTLGNDGNFYGTASGGGTNQGPFGSTSGTLFRMTPSGAFTVLASFNGTNGGNPSSELIPDVFGNFYGTTELGGTNLFLFGADAGNVYEFTTNNALGSLFSFNNTNGAYPQAALVIGADSNFYGTTELGGTNMDPNGNGYGTIFQLTPSGVFKDLIEFNGTNGGEPYTKLLIGRDGNFYGTTLIGGTNGNHGTVFQLTTNGVLKTLASFSATNGAGPRGGLVQGPDGSFYGSTLVGGTNTSSGVISVSGTFGYGTIYKLATNGTLTTLVYFNSTNGAYPLGNLIFGPDGNIYGTTSGYPGFAGNGTVFQLTPGGVLTTLVTFNGTNGSQPFAGLTLGTDRNFYGTTSGGGTFGQGTLFRVTVPMTPTIQPGPTVAGQFTFSWNSVANLNYQVQYNTNLTTTNWTNVGGLIFATSGTTFATNSLPGAQGFFRVVLEQ